MNEEILELKKIDILKLAAVITGLGYGALWLSKPVLKYFKPSEFGGWFPFVANSTLLKLDKLRSLHGAQIQISKSPGGIARIIPGGDDNYNSDHNIVKNLGVTHALDIYSKVPITAGYSNTISYRPMTKYELYQFYILAEEAGFTGIGVYPDWNNPGLHVSDGSDTGRWAGINKDGKQVYIGLMEYFRKEGVA